MFIKWKLNIYENKTCELRFDVFTFFFLNFFVHKHFSSFYYFLINFNGV